MDALTLIKTRHSTRKFLQKPIEKEKLEQVIEAGRFAPSGGNNQTTHFIVIQDAAVLEEMARIAREAFAKMELTEDTYASLATAIKLSKKGTYVFHYHAPVLVLTANRIGYGNNMADCSCAVENMMLMANALNLGSCWINQVNWLNDNPAMVAYLKTIGLQDGEAVYVSMALGYPDSPDGLPLRRVVPRKGNPVTYVG
ncbi:MAG: nitroreductase [Acidaminococcaceae bacterium]|nr:nitroreductase [Acidaminococcaceae bacterium]